MERNLKSTLAPKGPEAKPSVGWGRKAEEEREALRGRSQPHRPGQSGSMGPRAPYRCKRCESTQRIPPGSLLAEAGFLPSDSTPLRLWLAPDLQINPKFP